MGLKTDSQRDSAVWFANSCFVSFLTIYEVVSSFWEFAILVFPCVVLIEKHHTHATKNIGKSVFCGFLISWV